MLDIIALLLTLAALYSYVNYRFIKLPTTIGVMLLALLTSLALVALSALGWSGIAPRVEAWVTAIDFDEVVLHGMLSLLLFAGALHIDLPTLAYHKWSIGLLATVGVVASTVVIGLGAWVVFAGVGVNIDLIYCLLFGALIAPTDPIAVLSILKSVNAPPSLEIKIAGESLFNDGVAVVVFTLLLGMALGHDHVSIGQTVGRFLQEAVGGALFGLVIGYVAYRLIGSVDAYRVEVLLTLALVLGGYALALWLHVSGPIAMVVAGLLIGNPGRAQAMSDTTRQQLDTFWELIDDVLNTVLFMLIGFEVVVLTVTGPALWAALLAIPLVLLARFLCVGLPIQLMRAWWGFEFSPHAIKILTWSGVRGGISVALALSLPPGPAQSAILLATYAVVLFSILVQGVTLAPLVRAAMAHGAEAFARQDP